MTAQALSAQASPMRRARAPQQGLTLVELMVVVAIVGILVSSAMVTMRTRPGIRDIGHELVSIINEASRKAIAAGPMKVQEPRTQVVIATDPGLGIQVASLLRNNDDAIPPATLLSTRQIGRADIQVVGFSNDSDLFGGLGIDTPLGPGDQVELDCFPNGRCSAMTFYLEHQKTGEKLRVAVLPLNGTAMVFHGW